jgi:hypothetical protein
MAIPMKCVKNIRTVSGSVDLIAEPYRAFMRISSLEREKARRTKELECALEQIALIKVRFREIEAEKHALLAGLGDRLSHPVRVPAGYHDQDAPNTQDFQDNGSEAVGFRIRY